ncbi:hypothetical protein C8F04DRAFT_1280646 [Mycena alexandri]|uniref:Uncharacterized protein n=1 Tax=Mycena alexandri TaxID=1745969 RepID=A0AAD6WLF3_9AGAR|nr:hypothetical protein C8F04DRAFT_1280646 [Mycena alexandri]
MRHPFSAFPSPPHHPRATASRSTLLSPGDIKTISRRAAPRAQTLQQAGYALVAATPRHPHPASRIPPSPQPLPASTPAASAPTPRSLNRATLRHHIPPANLAHPA